MRPELGVTPNVNMSPSAGMGRFRLPAGLLESKAYPYSEMVTTFDVLLPLWRHYGILNV